MGERSRKQDRRCRNPDRPAPSRAVVGSYAPASQIRSAPGRDRAVPRHLGDRRCPGSGVADRGCAAEGAGGAGLRDRRHRVPKPSSRSLPNEQGDSEPNRCADWGELCDVRDRGKGRRLRAVAFTGDWRIEVSEKKARTEILDRSHDLGYGSPLPERFAWKGEASTADLVDVVLFPYRRKPDDSDPTSA